MFGLLYRSVRSLFGLAVFWAYIKYSSELNTKVVQILLLRPTVKYENPKYGHVFNMSSLRHSRQDSTYYMEICVQTVIDLDGSLLFKLDILEFMSNDYKPSFVHLQYNLCELLNVINPEVLYTKNISEPFIKRDLKIGCNTAVFEAGIYTGKNMKVQLPTLPQNFPVSIGRIAVTACYGKDVAFTGYIDFELKSVPQTKRKAVL